MTGGTMHLSKGKRYPTITNPAENCEVVKYFCHSSRLPTPVAGDWDENPCLLSEGESTGLGQGYCVRNVFFVDTQLQHRPLPGMIRPPNNCLCFSFWSRSDLAVVTGTRPSLGRNQKASFASYPGLGQGLPSRRRPDLVWTRN